MDSVKLYIVESIRSSIMINVPNPGRCCSQDVHFTKNYAVREGIWRLPMSCQTWSTDWARSLFYFEHF
ncbi:hypothetical protein M413DRAFT_249966 [Hebeloma cylindrosporum]|uniref:Uncharacterized protein n=1 Tax=Hebeloma cylindrosporum TaxID=76867 RepID=A0A0C3C340_HEBCY|nr:hypothetical protein M413DRAFT_249966 [Hebeloma cylindrosporum h7]